MYPAGALPGSVSSTGVCIVTLHQPCTLTFGIMARQRANHIALAALSGLLKWPASAVNSHASHPLLFKQPELSLSDWS